MADTFVAKRIESSDGQHRAEILDVGNGRFRFSRSEFILSKDDVDRQHHGKGYWSVESPSGLYSSAEEAEADARAETVWMREPPE